MNAVAIKTEESAVFESAGTVERREGGQVVVRTAEARFIARRAVSCLVEPEVGDLVLLATPAAGGAYVLAVLERPGHADCRISTEGNLTFELRSGRFTVAATQGVDLVSSQAVSVVADRFEARAREGSFLLDGVRLIAGAVDSTLERLSQTAKRVYRRVSEIEHVRAGQMDYAAEGNLRLHGENTLLTARELVKADAKQIHLG